jgi:hypothetical protein
MISGIVPRALKIGFCIANSVYFTILLKNRHFNAKILAGIVGIAMVENIVI